MKVNHWNQEIESRRKFLKTVAMGSAGFLLLSLLPGCADDPEIKAGTVKDLDTKGFLEVTFNGNGVFVTRREGNIVAFSLVCTHKRCTVKWKEDKKQFRCPCHKGTFDENGGNVSGPPKIPLDRFKTEMRGEEIWVLNQPWRATA